MYLGKAAHGMTWGWHQRCADHWRIGMTSHGGAFEKIHSLDQVNGEMLVKFGNDFGAGWIAHTDIPHGNWYFWDNPEIPQLLNPNPVNPAGNKDFVRFTRGSLFSEHFNTLTDCGRFSSMLEDLAPGTTLENLVRPVPVRKKATNRVLLCPSSPNCYTYYYDSKQTDWLWRWSSHLEAAGFEPVVRRKPDRKIRVNKPEMRLYETLLLDDYYCTISQHSVAALESIMAGTPAVVTGPHPAGELATPKEEFVLGHLRIPDQDQVWNWIRRVASNTYHKSELFSGAWHK